MKFGLQSKVGPFSSPLQEKGAGGWWEGVLGRAEGPGPCVVRSRLLLPQCAQLSGM